MSITHSTDRLEVAPGADGDAQATGSAAPGARGDYGATTVDLRADRTSAQPSGPEPQEHPRAAPDTSPGAARPTFTITDAAASCSVSRKTITRKLPELAGHGAAKDEDGVWRIPVEALLAVGLHPGRSLPQAVASPRPSAAPAPPPESTVPDTITVPRDRWDDLRIRLARAEAEASERALALADARLALRALTAGPTSDASRGPVGGGTSTSGAGATATDPGTDVPPSTPGSPAEGAASAFVLPATAVEATAAGALTPTAAAESTPAPPLQTPGPWTPSAPAAPATTGERPAPPGASGAAADDQGTAALVAARNEAARSGGYVPAAAAPTRKRRWWHSK
jgi:hypothetical protein